LSEELEVALGHASVIFNLLDPEWKLNTANILIAVIDLRLTIRLLEEHKEYVNIMLEAERGEIDRRSIFDD
jgi:hypothetical protein